MPRKKKSEGEEPKKPKGKKVVTKHKQAAAGMRDSLTTGGLPLRRQRFVEEYCGESLGQVRESAIRAGYSVAGADQSGRHALADPRVRAAIKERLDQMAMTAEEALVRMTNFARGTPAHFLRLSEDGQHKVIDLSTAEARDNMHLIKKLKVKERRRRLPGQKAELLTTETEIELYDAKDAVRQILMAHGKLVMKHEHKVSFEEIVASLPEKTQLAILELDSDEAVLSLLLEHHGDDPRVQKMLGAGFGVAGLLNPGPKPKVLEADLEEDDDDD